VTTADPTRIRKHSVTLAGHPTSISLEDAFWDTLKRIAARRGTTPVALITEIDGSRTGNLSSAIRVFCLENVSRPGPSDP